MASVEKIKTARGVRYEVRWWSDGSPREQRFTDRDTAAAFATRVEADKLDGLFFDPKRGKRALNDYFAEWLDSRLAPKTGLPLTLATKAGYRGLWRRHIADSLGQKRLRAVTPEVVRGWYGTIDSRDQAAKAYRLLHAVFETAVADELIRPTNPCRIKGAGQEHHDERPMVATSMAIELAEAVTVRRNHKGKPILDRDGNPMVDGRYHALVVLTAFAGTRTGEFLGLRRRHVDLLRLEISVEEQAHEIPGMGRVVIAQPKTAAGRRALSLPRLVADALETHLATYTAPSPDDFVFVGPEGKPLLRNRLSIVWQAACRQVGAPAGLRIYDLRHHALTLAARKPGITTKELMARGGHSSPRAALIYQHATRERDREVADFLDDAIAAAAPSRRARVVGLDEARGALAGRTIDPARSTDSD